MESKEQVSTFARIVDKLRIMDENELKLAYLRLFRQELEGEWAEIVKEADFTGVTDEDIISAVQKIRYKKHDA